MDKTFNDNDQVRATKNAPDAHGQAALLLTESLIHGLIARKVLALDDAIEVIEVAVDTKTEMAVDLGGFPDTPDHSLHLLSAIGRSLGMDRNGGGAAA